MMKSGKCCLLSSLVIIIGLGIGGYIFRDKIIHEYNKYWNSSESSVDENTTNDIYDSSEEIETTTIELITTSTSTTSPSTTKEDDHDEDYTDPNSDSSTEEDLTTLVSTTESSTTTTSTTQPSSTVRQYLPVQNSLPGMQPTIPSSTTKSNRIEGSGSGFRKSSRNREEDDDEDDDDYDTIVHSGDYE